MMIPQFNQSFIVVVFVYTEIKPNVFSSSMEHSWRLLLNQQKPDKSERVGKTKLINNPWEYQKFLIWSQYVHA